MHMEEFLYDSMHRNKWLTLSPNVQVEQEEEFLTNTLQKRLQTVQREKVCTLFYQHNLIDAWLLICCCELPHSQASPVETKTQVV